MPPERVTAFAPGRVNLIGEHTDYNQGLALPFAIEAGVTVTATRSEGTIQAPGLGAGNAFLRGAVAELRAAGVGVVPARLTVASTLPQGAGLSSSAALTVALTTALTALAGAPAPDTLTLARLCSRVENEWVGTRTGLLDQLASLAGSPGAAVMIDFRTLAWQAVPVLLGGWRLVTLDSGERRSLAGSEYNQRAGECVQACARLAVATLREAAPEAVAQLPEPLRSRVTHVLAENARVAEAERALTAGELPALAEILNRGHESLRDLFAVSTDAVEGARAQLLAAGAAGAKLIGGGFGGSVLGLLPPSATVPPRAVEVRPAAGARILQID